MTAALPKAGRHDGRSRDHPGRRARQAPLPPHLPPLQAGRADRRQVPAHRHPDQQLPARRHPAHLRADAVQFRVAQSARRPDLPPRPLLAGVRRHHRRRADARDHQLVPGHGRCGPARHAALHQPARRPLPDPRRRPSVPDGLRRDGAGARRLGRRHHDRGPADERRGRPRHGHLPLRSQGPDRGLRGEAVGGAPRGDGRQPAGRGEHRLHHAGRTSRSWPRWGSTSSPGRRWSKRSPRPTSSTSATRSSRRRSAAGRCAPTRSTATGPTSARCARSSTPTSA